MKKNLLLLVLAICASFTLSAQVSISPSPVSVEGITAADVDVAGYSTMTNDASEERVYVWERTEISISDGWESAVCDKNNCYFSGVSTKEVTMAAGEEGAMDIHVYPNGNEGAAVVMIKIYDKADTTISVTNTYYFNTPLSNENVEVEKITMFPNPTDGDFSITAYDSVQELMVYNLAGRQVKHFETNGNRTFSVADLPKGNYLVRMIGEDGSTLITKLLQKL